MSLLDLDARWRRFNDTGYTCSCCGMAAPGVYDIGFGHPDSWPHESLDEAGRDEIAVGDDKLSADLCKIEDDRFIRCVLPLPVRGSDELFHFGVWARVEPADFYAYIEHCVEAAPFDGCDAWLMNDLHGFEADVVPCRLTAGPNGQSPRLVAKDGPLAAAQTDGISFDDLLDIYAAYGNDLRPHLKG